MGTPALHKALSNLSNMNQIIDAHSSGVSQKARLKQILQENQIIAVVGLSPRPSRPSHRIATYLMDQGYQVIPVNPGHTEILGHTAYADLTQVPNNIDLVNVFRRTVFVPQIVQQAIDRKIRVLWLQDGIIHTEAALEAASAGIQVVMDRCIYRDHQQLVRAIPLGRILSNFRIQQDLSLSEVAKRLGMSLGELKALENSDDNEISPNMVRHIASAIEGDQKRGSKLE
jgi:predicted CoA-binding protein